MWRWASLLLMGAVPISIALSSISCAQTTFVVIPGGSIQAALDAAGTLARACGSPSTVSLQSGVHYLSAPLLITGAHSHVSLRGPSSSLGLPSAILDGGVLLPPFLPQPDGTWLTALPSANFSATTTPTTLSVGGVRRQRARSPNVVAGGGLAGMYNDSATYHAAGPLAACSAPAWGSCPPIDKWGFVYNASEAALPPLDPGADISGAFALVFASWTAEWVPLGAFVQANSSLMFAQGAHTPVGTYGFKRGGSPGGGRFVLENSRAFLDAPGEWFAAPLPDGRLWYVPLPGEDPQSTTGVAAKLPTILHVHGAPGDPVNGFSLTDVEVRNWGEWRPDARVGGDPSYLAALMVDSAVGTTVANVVLHAGASTGISWGGDVAGLLLDRVTVFDAGGSGIGALYNNNANASGILISNCTVHDVGDVYMSQPAGIALGGSQVSVLHNEVHSVAYSGIIGVQPGGPTPTTTTTTSTPNPQQPPVFHIAYNNISSFGLGVLNDFGGIYIADYGSCWLSNSCWLPADVHHNLVSHGSHYNYGASAFYSDQALSGVALHHNVLAAVGAVAIEAHCGCNNSGFNNVLYAPQLQAAVGSREGAFGGCNAFGFPPGLNSTYAFTHNVIHLTATPWVSSGEFTPPNGDYFSPTTWWSDDNVFFGVPPGAPMPLHYPNGTQGLPAWRAAWGCDVHSVEADPLLADPAAGNFNLLPGSPAWGLGWQNIDLSSVGPLPEE